MKKLLAMVLALVMTLSLAVSANAAFKDDKSISDDYAESVAVLNGMGVFKGYEDGSFKPEGNITRAEVATIIYRIYTADVAKNDKSGLYATYNKFSDMAGAGWAQGYIGYCANASLVKGYPDGTFKPSGKVTGYEVLTMILRAVGYDKNNEFSGADWALHVAQTAQQAGLLKNVKGVDLNAPTTRELVAELLFQGIQKAQVTYTPAFGYVTDKVLKLDESTLGYKNFKLVGTDSSDDWGRPATKWTYNVGDKSTLVVAKADASYTTKVDECDVAKDLGITSSKKIEAAYIDGKSTTVTDPTVTTDRNGAIDPKNTTSLVGAQGRLTEVYDMGSAGYRFVEINTYLAKVTKVTAASTDRNGHVTDATVDLKVYQVNDTGIDKAGVEAEGFTVGQYVLVTMTVDTASPVVQTVEAAAVTPMGQLKNWSYAYGTTAATTTLADTKYNDADKFYVGNVKGTAYTATAWDSIVDSYANLIGMVASSVNYVVVEKISWKHDNSTVAGGKALADLVLADGTKVAGATIASVDNAVTTNYNSGVVEVLTAEVADDYTNNNAYYNRIFTYSVNADGSYDLVKYCDATNVNSHNTGAVTITKGKTATIAGFTNTVVANTDTMFLVMDKDSNGNYTYYKNCCCKLTIRLYR